MGGKSSADCDIIRSNGEGWRGVVTAAPPNCGAIARYIPGGVLGTTRKQWDTGCAEACRRQAVNGER